MEIEAAEKIIGYLGLLGVATVLGYIFWGIGQSIKKPLSPDQGVASKLLRSPLFFVCASFLYFGFCYLIWKPLGISLLSLIQTAALAFGSLLFFSGLGLTLWARLSLGENYFVSTSQSAPLFIDHHLITSGPFAYVRHPMYLGLMLTGLGGILLYRTWTMLFVSLNFFGFVLRAKREEEALAEAHGQQWRVYCERVPAFLPRLFKKDR